MLPLSRTPHSFALIPVEGDPPLLPTNVFTVGPLVADLAALAEPTRDTVARLGRGLGFEWLSTLVAIDRPQGLDKPGLTKFLRKHYALGPGVALNPFGVRGGKLVARQPRSIPTQLLEEFVADEKGRLTDIGNTLASLAAPLLASARGKAMPRAARQQQQRAAELLNALGEPLRVGLFYDPLSKRSISGLAPRNLYVRALVELIELYDDTAPLGICARCHRLFIRQRNDDKYCRRYTWPARGGENIGGCIFDHNPTPTRAHLDSAAHRREYKKLQMRAVRSANEFGHEHRRTLNAKRAFEDWKREHPVSRGRRPMPMPADLLPPPK
jgi:hypothetical protein